MYCPNYLEFYQKALIPIGTYDLNALNIHSSNDSHWLIALDGQYHEKPRRYYTWKVLIFQTNSNGYIFLKEPFYISKSYESFHEAYDIAKQLEECGRKDMLSTVHLQDQIS